VTVRSLYDTGMRLRSVTIMGLGCPSYHSLSEIK
jgi:hypothetical protein